MKKNDRNINDVIHDYLLGKISDEDLLRLNNWLKLSPKNERAFNELINENGLDELYRDYAAINAEVAWTKFKKKKNIQDRKFVLSKVLHYAAAFLLPIAGAAILMWTLHLTSKDPISKETYELISRSEQMGKQKATLISADGIKEDIAPVIDKISKKVVVKKLQSVDANKEKEEVTPQESAVNNQVRTHTDSEYWVTFEDGTVVHLNYNTTIKYPKHFASTHRTVYLDGEAYFDVKKESKRPFRVVTKSGVVTEYGTSFNVNTCIDNRTEVVLVEGSISVTATSGVERMIKPGELAVMYDNSSTVQVKSIDIEPYVAWNSGRFVFDKCSLGSLMDVIGNWYGKETVFTIDELRRFSFTGDIDRYGAIEPILKALHRVTGLEFKISDKQIIIDYKYNSNN